MLNSTDTGKVRFLRNVAIVIGLWYAGGVIGGLVGLAMNQFPPYVASSHRPASLVVLRLIWVLPAAVGAFASGLGAPWLFQTSRWVPWTAALGTLVLAQYGMQFTGGWRLGELEPADKIAWPVNSAILAVLFILGVLVGRRLPRAKVLAA